MPAAAPARDEIMTAMGYSQADLSPEDLGWAVLGLGKADASLWKSFGFKPEDFATIRKRLERPRYARIVALKGE
jgi:hypothetical protein